MLICADAKYLPVKNNTAHCIVTSPPYWGLRDYKHPAQIGLESTYLEYIQAILETAKEMWRVLRDDGTLWLVLGDAYVTGAGKVSKCPGGGWQAEKFKRYFGKCTVGSMLAQAGLAQPNRMPQPGLRPKNLCGIPWRIALELQAAGWNLRRDIIWHKPNAMIESVRDRPTGSHEYIFLFSKSRRYYYDADSIKEPASKNAHSRGSGVNPKAKGFGPNSRVRVDRDPAHLVPSKARVKQNRSFSAAVKGMVKTRNKRSVWCVCTESYSGPHYSTFPCRLIEPCILAGCPKGGIVLDPFVGSGTTVMVAQDLGRIGIGLDISYQDLASERIGGSLFKKFVNSAWAGKSKADLLEKEIPEADRA